MMLHNNIGFNSEGSKDMATEITKKIPGSDHPTVVWRPLAMEPPRILHYLKVKFRATFLLLTVMSTFFQISVLSSQRSIICVVECGTAVQGRSSKVVDFGSLENTYGTSY